MTKIALITDSTADLPKSFVEENNIYITSLYVLINNSYYKDILEIGPEKVHDLNESDPDFTAKTSAPSPGDFSQVFAKVKNDGYDEAIYIGLNPKLSATIKSAEIADKHGLDVSIIDCGSVTLLQGIIVVLAANLLRESKEKKEIVEILSRHIGNQKAYAYLDTLKNLKASGRLGKAARRVSTILNLKPVLSIDGKGDFEMIKLKAKKEKSYDEIEKRIREDLKDAKRFYLSFIYGSKSDMLDEIRSRLIDIEERAEEVIVSSFGSVISVHTGPKIYAVGYMKIKD